jgi:hypothetical protein
MIRSNRTAPAVRVQEAGAIEPLVTATEADPVVSKIADWVATTGGAPVGALDQLVPRL